MRTSKRYIPVLITIALLALIGLQVIWLVFVYKHKELELKDKTREAVLETTKRLQQEEDSKLILTNMDSLLLTENIIGSDSNSPIRVIVSNIKNKLKVDTIEGQRIFKQKIEIDDDSAGSTTLVKLGNGTSQKIIISSESSSKNGSTNNTQSYSYSLDNYEKTAGEHQIKLIENEKKIIEHQKKLEEHLLKLEGREKQLAAKESENIMDMSAEKEALQKEKQAIEKQKQAIEAEKQAIEKHKQAIEAAKQAKIKGEYVTQIASIEIQNSKQEVEFEKLAKSAQSEAQKAQELALHSQLKVKKLEKKAGELQTLFLKMAVQSSNRHVNALSRINFEHVKELVKEELIKQGISIAPEVVISSSLKELNNLKEYFHGMATSGVHPDSVSYVFNQSFVSVPLFSDNFLNKDLILEVGFMNTNNYVLKSMAWLLSLSLFITILIGFVMIYIFRRMLSQEKLHQLKNDFINNMTHELKTPIATISLAVDGINNPAIKNDEAKFSNYTNILKEENKKLNGHVERVLQMALLEKGELMLDKKEVSLKFILEKCIKAYQLQIQTKNAKVNFSGSDVSVSGDEFHLLNAFTNLLDNALKYSGENSEISISLNKRGNTVEIIFKDNGIGIDKTIQEKVFEKFFRAQGGNLHDVKGFGLGLSYVKSIIEAHEGTIELKSDTSTSSVTKNKGSEFIIKLKSNGN